eukprot:CAMPEP_0204358006 /NCGR_PEP_ID=MMETSP0469-20131031/36208_1 /ASSEMBLY_ACC=CAM_ASM_000384 /TAXON_ID=2969 /ORGANISM="Oxyrrhis marina" /LENGTH=102 /DNA_ID=CAMNT_0051345799 /DNA_START=148 /DNA_END=456 /DNA_ORIENTATION=+
MSKDPSGAAAGACDALRMIAAAAGFVAAGTALALLGRGGLPSSSWFSSASSSWSSSSIRLSSSSTSLHSSMGSLAGVEEESPQISGAIPDGMSFTSSATILQ